MNMDISIFLSWIRLCVVNLDVIVFREILLEDSLQYASIERRYMIILASFPPPPQLHITLS